MRCALAILINLLAIQAFAQNAQSFFKPSLFLGANYSNLSQEQFDYSPSIGRSIGLSFRPEKAFRFKPTLQLSVNERRSWISSQLLLKHQSIDLGMRLSYTLEDFKFFAGLNSLYFLNDNVYYKGEGLVPDASKNFGYSRELEFAPFFGTEFHLLSESPNTFFCSYQPALQDGISEFKLGMLFALGQSEGVIYTDPFLNFEERQLRQMRIKNEIHQLKNGYLLIALQNEQSKIELLRSSGQLKAAEKFERKQKRFNQLLFKALIKEYQFSEIRFFYSHNADKVADENYMGIFLNENLELDSSIKIDSDKTVYTAMYTSIRREEPIYLFAENLEKDADEYYSHPNTDITALVIMDHQFNSLKKPFPYYTKLKGLKQKNKKALKILLYPFLGSDETSFTRSAKALNNKLYRHYYRQLY